MATILVTGGAGYVGAHCCLVLSQAGHTVVVYDDLSKGHIQFDKWGPLERGDIRDRERLRQVFDAHRPDAVLHCAALTEVGDSVKHPERFHDTNVRGTATLLDIMRETSTRAFVFSSSCAVYGVPEALPMREDHRFRPSSPYGQNKLDAERLSESAADERGGTFAHLRYFNAAGAAWSEGIGERHEPETHAIPLALFTLLGRREVFHIFGDDYDTRDGTCLRDYVHVLDLADAHVRAIDRLLGGGDSLVVNLGTGEGVTVRELIAAIERVTGKTVPTVAAPRREGDGPALLADNTLARRELDWLPMRNVDQTITDAWRWHAEVEPMVFRT
ncbi:MAG: UDP-glucose 4-epimerase GalE [Caulobacteraceae bacterium]